MTEELIFKASSGPLRLRRLGQRYVQQILAKPDIPEPPTYEATTVSGHVEVHPHDEESVETDEEKAEWHDYQLAKARALDERITNLTHFLLLEGVADDPPPLEEWGVDLERWEIVVPDDEDDLKVFWLENERCPGEEMGSLMARLYQLAGLTDDEGVQKIEAFFRSTLARLTTG